MMRRGLDLLLFLLLLVTLTLLLTYHLSGFLPAGPVHPEGDGVQRVEVRRTAQNSGRGLEGMHLEPEQVLSKRQGPQSHPPSDGEIRQLYARIKQVQDRLYMNRSGLRRLSLVRMHDQDQTRLYAAAHRLAGLNYMLSQHQGESYDICFVDTGWKNNENLSNICNKINSVRSLSESLSQRDSQCNTLMQSKNIPYFEKHALFPECFILPDESNQFKEVSKSRSDWVMTPTEGLAKEVQYLNTSLDNDWAFIQKAGMPRSKVVVHEHIANQMYINRKPFELHVFALVTHVSPLRAYIHSYGSVEFINVRGSQQNSKESYSWNLDKFKSYLTRLHGDHATGIAMGNVRSAVLQSLLYLNTRAACDNDRELNGFENGFLMLEYTLVLTQRLYPYITKIVAQPSVPEPIATDLVPLTTRRNYVIGDVLKMLLPTELDLRSIMVNSECTSIHACISEDMLTYLLQLQNEQLSLGGFSMIYPNRDGAKYTHLIDQLSCQNTFSSDEKNSFYHQRTKVKTRDVHSFLTGVVEQLESVNSGDIVYNNVYSENENFGHQNYMKGSLKESLIQRNCSNDFGNIPLLQSLYTVPSLTFTPALNVNTTDYYVHVPYELLLIQIWAHAQSCLCQARLNNKYGTAQPSNYTLGLGSNSISIVIVDISHSTPWIVNSYTFHIHRDAQVFSPLPPKSVLKPCSIIQSCDFIYLPHRSGGVQDMRFQTWDAFLAHKHNLPACSTGDSPGEWVLPCDSCGLINNCDWSRAVWQPHQCTHVRLERHLLSNCFANKRVLFIGDSTNRGIMHYIMDQVNQTLTEWDKTHDAKIYRNLNSAQTTMSFAYYPQFWLAPHERPMFDSALYQLIKISEPLDNSGDTVIVMGGVHWLATSHLTMLQQALQREGLEQAHMVIKSLGAGFHQSVDGMHRLTMEQQRKLVLHNNNLVAFARTLGFDVIDTFDMTMARPKDFLQGKCACHYHRVREVLPSFSEMMKTQSLTSKTDLAITFRVEGEINEMYSEMLVNQICKDYV